MDPKNSPASPVPGSQYVDYEHNRNVQNASTNNVAGNDGTATSQTTPVTSGVPGSPVANPTFQSESLIKSPRSKKGILSKISILIIIAILIGGYFVYAKAFTFEGIVGTAMSKANSALKNRSQFGVTLKSKDPEFNGSKLYIVSDFDGSTSGSPRLQVTADVSSQGMSAGVELRLVDNIVYGRIKDVPIAYSRFMGSAVGKWYSISLNTLKEMQKEFATASANVPKKNQSVEELLVKSNKIGLLKDMKFIGISSSSGVLVRKYSVSIDKDVLVYIMASTSASLNNSSNAYASQASSMAEKRLDMISFSPVIISVGLFSGSLRALEANIELKSDSQNTISDEPLGIHFSYNYDDTVKDILVEAPKDAMSMDSYVNDSLRSSRDSSKTAKIISDLSSVRVSMESYYDANGYLGGCSKAQNIPTLAGDIEKYGSKLVCRDSVREYVAYALLLPSQTSSAQYYCFDSTGRSTKLSKAPSGLVCK